MTHLEIKQAVDKLFSSNRTDDFRGDLKKLLDDYCLLVNDLSEYSQCHETIINTCKAIAEIIDRYYEGLHGESFEMFRILMNGEDGFLKNFGVYNVAVESNNVYYRARIREKGVNFERKDMFHIPLNMRGRVSTRRYSTWGHPCLYLGNTTYTCWEELGRPQFDNVMFSAYKLRRSFGLYDMRIPEETAYSQGNIEKTLLRLPFLLSCSMKVRNENDTFKPEYIIPQMFLELIICNSKSITKYEKGILDHDVIWGVIYTSSHVGDDFSYGNNKCENIALPAININCKSNYCNLLACLFDITEPMCYEFESLKDSVSRVFFNEDKIPDYDKSKFKYMEERLVEHGHFEPLPHITLNTPQNGIVLDWQGNPVYGSNTIEVLSSGSWDITVVE